MERLSSFSLLKLHSEFTQVYNRAKNAHSSGAVIFFLPTTEKKVGFTATKKIGNAVTRNRSKRRLRAMFMEFAPHLANGSYVFVAKQNTATMPFDRLRAEFEKSLKYLRAIER